MENNFRPVQVFGSAKDIEIRGDKIVGSIEGGIVLLGGRVFCAGDPGFQEVGVISNAAVKHNDSSTADVPGMGFPLPLLMDGPNRDVLVTKNTFKGGLAALFLGGEVEEKWGTVVLDEGVGNAVLLEPRDHHGDDD